MRTAPIAAISIDRQRGRFGVSLFPEIFYALQVLADPRPGARPSWRRKAHAAFPRSAWPLDAPPALWPAIADIPSVGPTQEVADVLDALRAMPAQQIQRRFLVGLLHLEDAVREVLAGADLAGVVGHLPRKKREWLAFVGLYPFEAKSATVRCVRHIVQDPATFRADLTATLQGFWENVFEDTWKTLRADFEESVQTKRRLFESLRLSEFLRHTLLPIEYDAKKRSLCALRGGYELPLAEIATCTFTPSVFNARRLWTTHRGPEGHEPWLPYLEPELGSRIGLHERHDANAASDVALVFRALGDTTRFALVSLIAQQPRTSVELAKLLSVSKPTISHHVHILRSAGLIRELEHGGAMMISLRKTSLARLSDRTLTQLFEPRNAVKPVTTRRNR